MKLFSELRGSTVILQRWLIPGWQLHYLRSRAAHLIFDFDDAVYLRDSYSKKGHEHPRNHRRFRQTIAACDAVAAGNLELASQAKKVVHDSRVHLIPTCVDLRKYPRNAGNPSDELELVWIGSSSTLQGIEAITPLLEGLGSRLPGLKIKIICDRFPSFKNLQIIPVRWQDATEVEELASSAIGFSWIPDDPWSRGKCGLKVLQYMAAGLPVLANPVGVQKEMVRQRENGFLVENEE
ncbi:MAG: glycosyltransferase, partial [Gemmataceae bacterium]